MQEVMKCGFVTVHYWLQALFGGMLAVLVVMMRQLDSKLRQERAANEAVKTAMVA